MLRHNREERATGKVFGESERLKERLKEEEKQEGERWVSYQEKKTAYEKEVEKQKLEWEGDMDTTFGKQTDWRKEYKDW